MLRVGIFAAVLTAIFVSSLSAATIWDGPTVTFTEPDGADSTQPQNRDCLTATICLTREPLTGGLFNALLEWGFNSAISPKDTEWAIGNLADYQTLTYQPWTQTMADPSINGVDNSVGKTFVAHLITDDIYLQVTMLSWTPMVSIDSVQTQATSAGFSWERTTAAVIPTEDAPEPATYALIAGGLLAFPLIRRRRAKTAASRSQTHEE